MATQRAKPITTTGRPPGGYQVAGTKLSGRPSGGYPVKGTPLTNKPLVPWVSHPREGYSGPTQYTPPLR
jgi:hypothetical protein